MAKMKEMLEMSPNENPSFLFSEEYSKDLLDFS